MLTMYKVDASIISGMKAGARGYILKDADKEDIIRAIRSVAAGEAIFGGDVASKLISRNLNLSAKTVANYVYSILNKLHAPDRTTAIQMVKQAKTSP